VYIVGFIAGYATYLPVCFIMQRNDVTIVYDNVFYGYVLSCFYFFPTIFMSVVYYKIGLELIKQNKYMKSECSNPVRRSAPGSSFTILKFIRNFFCLSHYRPMLCNWKYSHNCAPYFKHRWGRSFPKEIRLD
jgi:hypothetical protein